MSSIQINGNTSGSITIEAPAVAGTNTLTLPASTGTVITTGDSGTITQGMIGSGVTSTGPAFSAYLSADQTITNAVWTKVAIDTERFDTANCFDTTNYRFTPTVEGYYQVNITGRMTGGDFSFRAIGIYKNTGKYAALSVSRQSLNAPEVLSGSDIVYMNGTTDYLELYAIGSVTSGSVIIDYTEIADTSYFSAVLVRAA